LSSAFAPSSTRHPDEALRGRITCTSRPNGLQSEENPGLAEFIFEDLVLGAELLDDFLLLAVDPAGQDGEEELPGLENEVHG
jgi:hypothetical protein